MTTSIYGDLAESMLAFCALNPGQSLLLCLELASSVLLGISPQPQHQLFGIPLDYINSMIWLWPGA